MKPWMEKNAPEPKGVEADNGVESDENKEVGPTKLENKSDIKDQKVLIVHQMIQKK